MKLRSRIIKPELFQNKKLGRAGQGVSFHFVGLWIIADREGRLINEPDLIKGLLYPFIKKVTPEKIIIMTNKLVELGFVYSYSDGEDDYLWIPTFTEHQTIHKHEAQSIIPQYTKDLEVMSSNVDTSTVNVSSSTCSSTSTSTITSTSISTSTSEGDIPFKDIIEHLNYCANTKYKYESKKTQSLISARWNEGVRLEDFRYVHAVKVEEWINTDMEKYIRPETLYSNKFEGYRQQKPKSKISDMPEWQKKNAELVMKNIKG